MKDLIIESINNEIKLLNELYDINMDEPTTDLTNQELINLNNNIIQFKFFMNDIKGVINSWSEMMKYNKNEYNNVDINIDEYTDTLIGNCIEELLNNKLNYPLVVESLTILLNDIANKYKPSKLQVFISCINTILLPMIINLIIILIVYLVFFR